MHREGIPQREKLPIRERLQLVARNVLLNMGDAGAPFVGVVTLKQPVDLPNAPVLEAEYILWQTNHPGQQ